MRGGSLTRYHTPIISQVGSGFTDDLFQIAGPAALRAGHEVFDRFERGEPPLDVASALAREVEREAKRVMKTAVKRKAGDPMKQTAKRIKDIS